MRHAGMRVLVAPDKLKGSLGAADAAAALGTGFGRGAPQAQVTTLPLADGGEGTLDALHAGPRRRTRALGPDGAPHDAEWGLSEGGAVIESARIVGLALMERPRTATATSFGLGELVRAALDHGAREIVIGLGGSATTDGGAGMLQALGLRIAGAPEPIAGADLEHVTAIDRSGLDPRLRDVRVVCACDVDSPLLGPRGSAATFAPQKGARDDEVAALERGLERWAALLGAELATLPHTGAAGGIAFAARAALGAELVGGADFVLDRVGFDDAVKDADVVVTAEGRLDAQTLAGKLVARVAARAKAHGVPVIAVAGSVELDRDALAALGVDCALSLCAGPMDEARAKREGRLLLVRIGSELGALLAATLTPTP